MSKTGLGYRHLLGSVLGLTVLAAGATSALAVPFSTITLNNDNTGAYYITFDELSTGDNGGVTRFVAAGGPSVTLTTSTDAQVVLLGAGTYAPPVVTTANQGSTPSNTTDFGIALGTDATNYVTSGKNSDHSPTGASVTVAFQGDQTYLGLLWGSVDSYNTLELLKDGVVVDTITGSDIFAAAASQNITLTAQSQGADGTVYVNLSNAPTFDAFRVTSSNYAFEFDNVAFKNGSNAPNEVPLPPALLLIGSAIAGAGLMGRRRKGASALAT